MPCGTNTKKEDLCTRNEVCVAPGKEPDARASKSEGSCFQVAERTNQLHKAIVSAFNKYFAKLLKMSMILLGA